MKRGAIVFAIIASFFIALTPISATAKPPSIHREFMFMSDFLKALNGAGVKCKYTQEKQMLFVREAGQCVWRGQKLYLTLFADRKTEDMFRPLLAFSGYYFAERNWIIQIRDGDTAQALSKLIRSKVN